MFSFTRCGNFQACDRSNSNGKYYKCKYCCHSAHLVPVVHCKLLLRDLGSYYKRSL